MSYRAKKWVGQLASGLGVVALLALAGCYATAGSGAYYAEPAPAQAVYYAPAPAQVQVQVQPAQPTYYVQPQPTYYVQPAQPTVYVQPAQVYVQPGQPAATVQYQGGWGHQRPVVIQQGGGEPVRVEVRGQGSERGVVHVR